MLNLKEIVQNMGHLENEKLIFIATKALKFSKKMQR